MFSDVGQLFGTYLTAAGFTECLSGNGKIYSTKSMKVATDALGVLPNSGDPFSQVELLKSDGVLNLSLRCNNLSGQPIPKNLHRADLAALRQCASVELNIPPPTAALLSREALLNKIINHRVEQSSFVGINSHQTVLVDGNHPFRITVRFGCAGKCTVKLSFSVTKEVLVFNQDQPPVTVHIF